MAKILAVDDDLCILELYKEILTKAGFEVHTAEDASSAMMKYQTIKPDLLILDVDMPAGGGQKVFDRMRNLMMNATPIIFSTGKPQSVAALEKNLNVLILPKPVNPEVLIEAIKKLLKLP
jgi:DNA-binding response OmpR family regulator